MQFYRTGCFPLNFLQSKIRLIPKEFDLISFFPYPQQDDVFTVLDRARQKSRSDSQIFEDACELQSKFIDLRDEQCNGGALLWSPALSFTKAHLAASMDQLRAEKAEQEAAQARNDGVTEDEARERREEDKIQSLISTGETCVVGGNQYRVGDFVYIVPREKGMEPHIIQIEKFYREDGSSAQMIWGTWYYR
jgi:protein polybromo-1